MISVEKNKLNKKGIILLEAIIALAVIVVVMTALVTALVSSLNNSSFSDQQTVATAYAQEGIDIARNQKNADFATFQTLEGPYPLGQDDTVIPGSSAYLDFKPGDDRYTRYIYVNNSGMDENGVRFCTQTNSIFVSSTVSWSDSKCSGSSRCHEVNLTSCFVNLNSVNLN